MPDLSVERARAFPAAASEGNMSGAGRQELSDADPLRICNAQPER